LSGLKQIDRLKNGAPVSQNRQSQGPFLAGTWFRSWTKVRPSMIALIRSWFRCAQVPALVGGNRGRNAAPGLLACMKSTPNTGWSGKKTTAASATHRSNKSRILVSQA
jgi:hypothetical protein